MWKAITIALIAASSAWSRTAEKPLRVFILAGQSNMVGADAHAREIDSVSHFRGAGKPQEDVRYWYIHGPDTPKNGSGGWIPLQPDRRHGFFGPELTFARELKRRTSMPFAIIKSAWGGTTLAQDWNPDEPSEKRLYARTLELVRTALADLKRRKIAFRLEAVLWHQGENDMLNRELMGGYGERLAAFVARVRKDLGEPTLPWLIGEISDKGIWGLDHRRNMQIVRRQQRAVADADPHVWFVPTSHLAFAVMKNGQPHYHFGTAGQLQHGVAYADAYLGSRGMPRPPPPALESPGRRGPIRVLVVAGQRSAEGADTYMADARRDGRWQFPGAEDVRGSGLPYRYRVGGGAVTGPDWGRLQPVGPFLNFGPEVSLGRELLRRSDDDRWAIVKVTHSAAVLADWLPHGDDASRPQYAGAVAFIREAMDDLEKRGFDPTLGAVFWIPGEHDCYWGPFRRRYAKDLETLVSAMRRDLRSPKLPWLVAELADNMRWGEKRLDELDAQIEQVARKDPHLWFIPTDDVTTEDGCVDFGARGTIELGRLLARRYLELTR